jgi:hypothetical protein
MHYRCKIVATGWLVCSLSVALVVLTGCSGEPAAARVRGRVAYKDGSVPQGEVCIVRFEPALAGTAPKGRAATGDIGRDGSFDMYTKRPGDGVVPGEYVVTFTVMKSHLEPESLIDEKYTKADTTPYKITVDEDVDGQVFEIEPRTAAAEPAAGTTDKPNEEAASSAAATPTEESKPSEERAEQPTG